MPKKPKEMEKIILADGWVLKSQEGSHRHIPIQQSPERLQSHFIVKISPRAPKTQS